jgi:hypothetical protein
MEITSISGNYHKVSADESYYYVVGPEGMVILTKDLYREFASVSGTGFMDVWTSPEASFVYIATSGRGVAVMPKSSLSGGTLSGVAGTLWNYPYISSEVVLSLDGLDDQHVLIGTSSGVNYFKQGNMLGSSDWYPVTTVSVATEEEVYYGGPFGLAAMKQAEEDWETVDLAYLLTESSVPALPKLPVHAVDAIRTDEFITVGIATASGVSIIKEKEVMRASSVMQLFVED